MSTRLAVAGLTVLVVVGAPVPATSQQPELDPEHAAIARSIESQLIAPCCFRQTIAEHQSPLAESIRAEVRQMVAAGAGEQEVVSHFVDTYGEAILAAPRAGGVNLLAYIVPGLVFAAGLAIVLLRLRRWRRETVPRASAATGPEPSAGSPDADLRARFEAELAASDR